MKWFLTFLAISLTASEKLDRTYLPPPGAQFAGGNSEDIQAPFETPNKSQPVNIPAVSTVNELNEFEATGQPTHTTPVTTTSYAFTQTTTYPSVESYETTAVPINPVTGLPILGQNGQQQYGINLPGFIQSPSNGVPTYGTNIQSGSLNQLPNQIITPGGTIQIPDSISAGLDQSFAHHGQPNSQIFNQYPGQSFPNPGTSVVLPGSSALVPGDNQVLTQYPSKTNTPKDQFSETTYQELPLEHVSQGIYSKQPIIESDAGLPQYNYQKVDQPNLQQSSENQNKVGPGSIIGQNVYNPTHSHGGILGTAPGSPSSVSAHASINDNIINRPERPQATAELNAVIINHENVRTPNGYSYNFDTSNGIHADETATVDDGTRAQGSYSYIGDDGKVYTVTYTADENGFQPHGDHLPTPPPIPEAIQKVIEQAARDEVAGIMDDGSYDEVKYGYDQYQKPMSHRHPQIKDRNSLDKNYIVESQRKIVKPNAAISENTYYESEPQDHFTSDVDNIKNIPAEKYVTGNSNNKISNVNELIVLDGMDGNKIIVNNEDRSLLNRPNDLEKNNFDLKKQSAFAQFPHTKFNNSPNSGDYNPYDRNIGPKNGHLPANRPILPHTSQVGTDYPGSQVKDIKESDIYPNNEERFTSGNNKNFDQFEQLRPDHRSYSQDNGFPPIHMSSNKYTKDKRPQSDQFFAQGNVGNFGKIQKDDRVVTNNDQTDVNQLSYYQDNIQQINDNGYHYSLPQDQFPTRFNAEENYLTTRPLDESTTLRPFVTSEVHNQPLDVRRNENRQNYNTQPFMTSSVTAPKKGPNTHYDDGDDYDIDQDINENSPTRKPNEHIDIGTRRRLQPTHTTSRPQYTPSDNKEPVSLGQKIENSVTPSFTHSTTTPIPSQNHPSTSITVTPVISASGYYDTTSTPASVPSYGSRIPSGQRVTSIKPTTLGYQPSSGPMIPSRTPQTIRQPTGTDNRNRYQYTTTVRPQIPERLETKTFFPGVSTRIYPTTSAPINYSATTSKPPSPDRQGILYVPGKTVSAPLDAYQTGYQYEPPKIVSNDGSLMNTGPLGSYVSQTSPSDFEYGSPGPVYSTTLSPSTIGTTPASLIPSPTPSRLPQTYSTTQRPGYSSTQNIYDQTPLVDGFGRPIPSEPQTRFSSPGHDQRLGTFVTDGDDRSNPDVLNSRPISQGGIPIKNVGSVYEVEPSPKYPDYYNQLKVIGEDFTGPQQPQRFDPQTGYHYK